MTIMLPTIPPHILKAMSMEMALLIACARSQLTEGHKSAICSLLDKELDWDSIISNSIYHKVIPLLHRSLSTSFPDKVPASAMSRIKTYFKESSLYTFIISASLLNLLSLLHENGIPVLPVKGTILAEKLYGSTTMRSYSDVDILVHQVDLEKSLNVLLVNKYTLLPEGIPKSTFLKFLQYFHHGRLLDRNGILIELHWELSGFYAPEPITLEKLEPFITKTVFHSCPTLALSNEMLFVFLCLHGNKHCWEKLDYICSMAELVNVVPELDWDLIIELGKKYKMTKRVLISCFLMKQLFSTFIPERLLDNNLVLEQVADGIVQRIINPNKVVAPKHPFQSWIYYQAKIFDSRLNALRYIFRSIIVPEHNDWQQLNLPESLFLFHFLYRPFLVFWTPVTNRIKLLFQSNDKK